MYFFTNALIMVNRMEEVKTVATRRIYVVHHFLVRCPHWTFRYWRLFHVPKIFKSVSKSRRKIDNRPGRALCGELSPPLE